MKERKEMKEKKQRKSKKEKKQKRDRASITTALLSLSSLYLLALQLRLHFSYPVLQFFGGEADAAQPIYDDGEGERR
jgi:hypothetical protein